MRGIGKTLFNHEFLGLLADYLAEQRDWGQVASLRAALKNSKTVVLDIGDDNALGGDELEWPPAVILGLRLAHQYWWPHVSYKQVRHAFQSQAAKDPRLWDTFHVCRVFTAIQRHKPPPTSAEPSPRIPAVLHVAIDEIPQEGAQFRQLAAPAATVRCPQPRAARPHEPGPRDLHYSTLSGTSARHPDEVLEPMDGTSTVRGQEWLDKGGKPFERLLATLGANPCALECLERVLRGSPSQSLCLDDISAKLIAQVQRTFKVEDWARQAYGQLGILLALAGIPVWRDSVVNFEEPDSQHQQKPQPVTVADLERAGIVHLHSLPRGTYFQREHWTQAWYGCGHVV